jgi:hypothetical protein
VKFTALPGSFLTVSAALIAAAAAAFAAARHTAGFRMLLRRTASLIVSHFYLHGSYVLL